MPLWGIQWHLGLDHVSALVYVRMHELAQEAGTSAKCSTAVRSHCLGHGHGHRRTSKLCRRVECILIWLKLWYYDLTWLEFHIRRLFVSLQFLLELTFCYFPSQCDTHTDGEQHFVPLSLSVLSSFLALKSVFACCIWWLAANAVSTAHYERGLCRHGRRGMWTELGDRVKYKNVKRKKMLN